MATLTWITISLPDLNHYLVGPQLTALNTAALGSGQADRFTRQRDDTVARMRNAVESGGAQLSLTAATIPPELRWVACYLIIDGIQAGLPFKLTQDQKDQIERAVKELEKIEKGELLVSTPTDPDPASAARGDWGSNSRLKMPTEPT